MFDKGVDLDLILTAIGWILMTCVGISNGKCAYVTPSFDCHRSYCPKVAVDSCYQKGSSYSDKYQCTDGGAKWSRYDNSNCEGDADDIYTSIYSDINGAKSYDCDGSGDECIIASYTNSYFGKTFVVVIDSCIENTTTICEESKGIIAIILYLTSDCSSGTEIANYTLANTQNDYISINCDASGPSKILEILEILKWVGIGVGIFLSLACCIGIKVWSECNPFKRTSCPSDNNVLKKQVDYAYKTNLGNSMHDKPAEYEEGNNAIEANQNGEEGEINENDKYSSVKSWFVTSIDGLENDDKQIYFDAFIENGFENFIVIKEMSDDDLKEIGIDKLGHRKAITMAIQQL